MSQAIKQIGLRRQLTTCALLSGVAALIIFCFHQPPYLASLLAGLPLHFQVAAGLGIGCAYWVSTQIGYRFAANSKTTKSTVESYSRMDLSGRNPIWISLAAGFGEELLFRGSLQPLTGVWLASAIFVIAHTRAYRFNGLNKRVLIQACAIFVGSMGFGLIAMYVGLVAAMITHAAVDIVGLYVIKGEIRKLQPQSCQR
ncbi:MULTISPECIES: CPBP family intramembrane glutamic endopeptidase [unclassified Duganella]|uniref:CPBP family intramembrane glutamic endopeptidase n=1 Tax=unclassified Duganella TaxID=2636909 RepID=UPI000E34F9F6|nr:MULTISPECIES: CPBP family intramembrane glutamic endopeptidase [unclassified Duganella]RFP09580.1 CPBP family intramembrane metalloprotease [Duganella sp. BJB475]RFP27700.1 CPBP family intramembrane metalloprotease [Duganella sp. BJB476]